jgi:nitrite reductase (NADH) large subunit
MTNTAGLVVIGHGPAGAAAAAAFRERDPRTPVKILTAEAMACYSRPRLPEVVSGQIPVEAIKLHPDKWYTARQLDVCLNQGVVRIDRDRRVVVMADGEEVPYAKLILATGADPLEPPIAGLPALHVYRLRTAADALAIHARAVGRRTAALVGGGLLGLEAGFSLTRLGLRVMVIEQAPWLLPRQVDADGSALLQAKLRPLGFDFFLGARVERIGNEADQVRLRLTSGHELVSDLVLISAGIAPRIGLAQAAGLTVRRGIVVNDRLQTDDPDIYAAGDAAEWHGDIAGLWPAAQAMGRVAGSNAAGGRENYAGQVASTTLKVAGVELCSQGDIAPEQAQIWVRQDAARGTWCKLFVRAGILAGSIQIGSTAGAFQLKRLIDLRLPIAGWEAEIMKPDFDFSRIPGFPVA